MKFIISSQLHLNIIVGIVPCKRLQDTLGFWILRRGFGISKTGFRSLFSGFQSLVGIQISRAVFWIPEGKLYQILDSTTSKNFPGFRNQDFLHGAIGTNTISHLKNKHPTTTTATIKTTKKLISLSFVIKRAKYFNLPER